MQQHTQESLQKKKKEKKKSTQVSQLSCCTLMIQSVQTAGYAEVNQACRLCSDMPSSRADFAVSEEFLHPLYLAFVLWHGFVVHAILQEMFLAVMDLSAVLQLEGAECFQRLQQNLQTQTGTEGRSD